jgi:hypothetical protein
MAEKKKHLIKVQDQLVPVNEEVFPKGCLTAPDSCTEQYAHLLYGYLQLS